MCAYNLQININMGMQVLIFSIGLYDQKSLVGLLVSDQYRIIETKFTLWSATSPTKGKDEIYETAIFKTLDVRQRGDT